MHDGTTPVTVLWRFVYICRVIAYCINCSKFFNWNVRMLMVCVHYDSRLSQVKTATEWLEYEEKYRGEGHSERD